MKRNEEKISQKEKLNSQRKKKVDFRLLLEWNDLSMTFYSSRKIYQVYIKRRTQTVIKCNRFDNRELVIQFSIFNIVILEQ